LQTKYRVPYFVFHKANAHPSSKRIQPHMPDSVPPHEHQHKRSSRTLVFVMLGIIILSIVAFLVLRPDPSGDGHSTTHTTTDH
jgi:hypothetical protein